MNPLMLLLVWIRAFFHQRATTATHILALQQQLAVYQRTVKRPRLRRSDRIFWVWLKRFWSGWQQVLLIVQPDTVCHWHRQGFQLYWRWKSRAEPGRPKLEPEIRTLVRRMARENPTWGAPRIQSELHLLGYEVAESTVAKYMPRGGKPTAPTWKTFLNNHLSETVAIDFFTVPTITFRVLYVFVVLSLDRRRVLHFNVMANPSAQWTAQQITEAFPFDSASRYLQRDRDGIYGQVFRDKIKSLGMKEVVSAPKSPWQNGYVERLIGSIRRECLDHVIVLGEVHLKRILAEYFEYYHNSRTHLALDRNAPNPREIEPPERGKLIAIPQVGGLHHRYTRAA